MKRISTYINVMSDEEVERIHRNSLRILAEIGLHVPNDEVLGMCREQGGEVNADKQVVRIPVKVMESLLEKVQAHSRMDYETVQRNSLCAGISTQVFFFDYATKSRRYGMMDDVMKGISLLEHLDLSLIHI